MVLILEIWINVFFLTIQPQDLIGFECPWTFIYFEARGTHTNWYACQHVPYYYRPSSITHLINPQAFAMVTYLWSPSMRYASHSEHSSEGNPGAWGRFRCPINCWARLFRTCEPEPVLFISAACLLRSSTDPSPFNCRSRISRDEFESMTDHLIT